MHQRWMHIFSRGGDDCWFLFESERGKDSRSFFSATTALKRSCADHDNGEGKRFGFFLARLFVCP